MFVGGKFVGESYVIVVSFGTATGSTTTTGTTLWPLTKSWIELVLSLVVPSTMVTTIFASSGTSVAPFKGLVDLTNGTFTFPQITASRGRAAMTEFSEELKSVPSLPDGRKTQP